ncbi:MAG TPA: hypothetical protein VMT62_02295, partial [Syntrophorhabdaceae bacterium]|nr:hypothetical protein [Syntrophorhabdaceae bacterium]
RIFTNAFDVSEEVYEWIGQNRSNVGLKVSIDGIEEDNDKRRVDLSGTGTYSTVIQNLKRLILTHAECDVITVLSKLNLSNIERFVHEMAAIGVKTITANIFCGRTEDERLMELTEGDKFEAIRRMEAACEIYGMEFDGEWKFAVTQMITGAHFSCPAGITQLVFSADGVIYPCQRFAGTEMNFGTYEDDFWEKLLHGRCNHYDSWAADLYGAAIERTREEKTDLTGWSCPFLPFLRGECVGKNLDSEFNQNLLEYYVTRPLSRIRSKSPVDCSSH